MLPISCHAQVALTVLARLGEWLNFSHFFQNRDHSRLGLEYPIKT